MITRMSERHLAMLYEQTGAPVMLHSALHAQTLDGDLETRIDALLRANHPDLALISLGLCAVVLAEFLVKQPAFEAHHALITEMKYLGIESVETFGPPYLGEDIGLANIDELLELCPIQLCALGSLFDDMGEYYGFIRTLSAVAYDQADRAEALLSGQPAPHIINPNDENVLAPAPSNVVALDLFTAWRKDKKTDK